MKSPKILPLLVLQLVAISFSNAFQVKQNVVLAAGSMIPAAARSRIRPHSNMILTHRSYRGGATVANANQSNKRNSALHMAPEIPISIFSNAPFNQSSLIFLGTNALGFAISVLTGSHLHLDLLGTGAFALASLPTLLSSASCTRVALSSAAVFTWGTKLASFLFFRALKVKTDGRLDETLSTVGGTFGFWFISLLWGVVCSLPHTLGTTSSNPGSPITLAVGGTVYLLGLATESMADYQKWSFKNNSLNAGQFCNSGLWSISQHPNFFGNLLIWAGILIMNSDSLIQMQSADAGIGIGIDTNTSILSSLWGARRLIAALLSPLFMWTLFSGQANGTITNSVALANAKYGKDPIFQEYVKNVPSLIPNFFPWLKELFVGLRAIIRL